MKASSESGLWAMRMMVVAGSVMAPESIRMEDARIEDTRAHGRTSEGCPLGRTPFRPHPPACRETPLFSMGITGGTPFVYIECQKRGVADRPRPIHQLGEPTMTTKNRNLAKGMLPALLLSAALSVPATALAAPASHGKAHAADKAKSHQEKAQQQARKAQQAQRGPNRKQTAVVVAPQRRVVVAPQRVVVPQRRVVVVPAQPVVVAQRNRNRAQYDGWNRR